MSEITDKELRAQLKVFGKNVGPINSDTVRKVLYKKLLVFRTSENKTVVPQSKAEKTKKAAKITSKEPKETEKVPKSSKTTKSVQKKKTVKLKPECTVVVLKFDNLSDTDFRRKCIEHGLKPGPISGSTRNTWENKLRKFLNENKQNGDFQKPMETKILNPPKKESQTESDTEEETDAHEVSMQTDQPSFTLQESREETIKKVRNKYHINNSTPVLEKTAQSTIQENTSNWTTIDDSEPEEMDTTEDGFFLSTQDILDETENYDPSSSLRPIVIDGSNIACAHGKQKIFSFKGIEIVYKYFLNRGHEEIYVVLPHARTSKYFRGGNNLRSTDFEVLERLNEANAVCISPARQIGTGGQYIASYRAFTNLLFYGLVLRAIFMGYFEKFDFVAEN